MHTFDKLRFIICFGLLLVGVRAQTYVGNLDGVSVDSTFGAGNGGSGVVFDTNLSTYGWTSVGGSPSVIIYTNSIMAATASYANFDVLYGVDSTPFSANTTYTLTFDIGYGAGNDLGTVAQWTFQLGTWDGNNTGSFSSLASEGGTSEPAWAGNFLINSANGTSVSLTYTTGSSVSGSEIAIRFLQSYNGEGKSDFLGFDNVTLTASAVPEPSTYAAIFGGLSLAGAAWLRRRNRVN